MIKYKFCYNIYHTLLKNLKVHMQTFSRTYMSKMHMRNDAFILLSIGLVLVGSFTGISITQGNKISEWVMLGIHIKPDDFFAFVKQQRTCMNSFNKFI